jgi:hypothetical protein
VDDSFADSHHVSWNRHSLATNKVKKVEKVTDLGSTHTLGLFHTKGKTCANFGSDWFKNVDLYKVQTNTNKQTKTKNFQLYI